MSRTYLVASVAEQQVYFHMRQHFDEPLRSASRYHQMTSPCKEPAHFPGFPSPRYLHFPFILPFSIALSYVFHVFFMTMCPPYFHSSLVTTRRDLEESCQTVSVVVDQLSPPAGHIVVVQHQVYFHSCV